MFLMSTICVLAEEEAVRNINSLLVDDASAEELCRELRRSEADLCQINDTNTAILYHKELINAKNAAGRVS